MGSEAADASPEEVTSAPISDIMSFRLGPPAELAPWKTADMASRSADIAGVRPFYALHADAYDQLITDPVEGWARAVHDRLLADGVPQAALLEAGCGTGRHARGLIDLGHDVTLFDASAALLDIARRRCPDAPAHRGDICALDLDETFQAITCRGVLNDLVSDAERDAALVSFVGALRPGGLLLLDVREAECARRRADGVERRSEARLAGGGLLVFTSRPTWADGLIDVEEQYELTLPDSSATATHAFRFQMRPWSAQTSSVTGCRRRASSTWRSALAQDDRLPTASSSSLAGPRSASRDDVAPSA